MQPRQSKILEAVVSEYIRLAEPISSNYIIKRHPLNVSSATVRNDFQELEGEGYLQQPHTSAGRIPTNKGYRFYVDEVVLDDGTIARETTISIRSKITSGKTKRDDTQKITDLLADTSRLFAFLFSESTGFSFSGMKNLISAPDFDEREMMIDLAETLDELKDVSGKWFEDISEGEKEIFIGKENPYLEADELSTIVAGFRLPDDEHAVAGIVGPTRMPYEKLWKLMEELTIL